MTEAEPNETGTQEQPQDVEKVSGLTMILSWVVTLLTVVALVMTSVRLLLFPAFLTFEYNTPAFPDDPYGFSKADRLQWANKSMDYLVNDAGVEYVGDLRFPDGSPVFNERELQHFVDVKAVLTRALNVWLGSLVLLVILGFLSGREKWSEYYRIGLRRGAWLTVFAIAGIILFVALSFNMLFVAFHNVFFDPGTWMFNWSDTFIRLFPQRFWRDIFIYIGVMSIGGALLLIYFLRRK